MNGLRTCALLFVLSFTTVVFGQSQLRIEFRDSNTGEVIDLVQVAKADSPDSIIAVSDKKGSIAIDASLRNDLQLVFTHVSYSTRILSVAELKKNTIVTLKYQAYEIGPAVVNYVDTVFKSEVFHVADFSFLPNDQLLLLSYGKKEYFKPHSSAKLDLYGNCQLILLSSNNTVLDSLAIDEYCLRLRDFGAGVFLQTQFHHFKVLVVNSQVKLEPVSTEKLNENEREHVIEDDYKIVDNNINGYPAFDYLRIDKLSLKPQILYSYHDAETLSFLRSEYKYLSPRAKIRAHETEMSTGLDKEIAAAFQTGFKYSQYYEEPNCPLFRSKQGLVVFNHMKGQLARFDSFGNTLCHADFNYHEDRKMGRWQEEVLHDEVSDKFYTLHLRDALMYLREIDIETGQTLNAVKLSYPFVGKVKVRDGFAYYNYRPYGSPQKFYLYKEALQ